MEEAKPGKGSLENEGEEAVRRCLEYKIRATGFLEDGPRLGRQCDG